MIMDSLNAVFSDAFQQARDVFQGIGHRTSRSLAQPLRTLADRLDPPDSYGYDELSEAAQAIRQLTGVDEHRIVMVLGSGYGDITSHFQGAQSFSMGQIPHMPVPQVSGHNPNFYSFPLAGENILIYGGRIHGYEGHPFDEVTFPVRAAILAGAQTVILTNAAGGVDHGPGSLVFLQDHLIESPMALFPKHDERLGPRFLDPSGVWNEKLRSKVVSVAQEANLPVFDDGVYVWGHGPLYETPRYVDRMHTNFGATLFGMSTVPEALAAHAMGARVLAFSTVSNWAAGKNPAGSAELNHEEVKETLSATRGNVLRLIDVSLPICLDELTEGESTANREREPARHPHASRMAHKGGRLVSVARKARSLGMRLATGR